MSGAGIPNVQPLKLLRREAPTNEDVLTFEFSHTRFEQLSDGRRLIAFEPLTHKGNIVIHHPHGAPGKFENTACFDVSFPALQGASGAPVILQSLRGPADFLVVGMLAANVERHLLPAQVIRIQEREREEHQTKYFLPFGRGIEGRVIIEFLRTIDGKPEVVKEERGKQT